MGDAGLDNAAGGVSGLMTEAIDILCLPVTFVTTGAGWRGGASLGRIEGFAVFARDFRALNTGNREGGEAAGGGDVAVGEVCVTSEGIERFRCGFSRNVEGADVAAIVSALCPVNCGGSLGCSVPELPRDSC